MTTTATTTATTTTTTTTTTGGAGGDLVARLTRACVEWEADDDAARAIREAVGATAPETLAGFRRRPGGALVTCLAACVRSGFPGAARELLSAAGVDADGGDPEVLLHVAAEAAAAGCRTAAAARTLVATVGGAEGAGVLAPLLERCVLRDLGDDVCEVLAQSAYPEIDGGGDVDATFLLDLLDLCFAREYARTVAVVLERAPAPLLEMAATSEWLLASLTMSSEEVVVAFVAGALGGDASRLAEVLPREHFRLLAPMEDVLSSGTVRELVLGMFPSATSEEAFGRSPLRTSPRGSSMPRG